MKKIALLFGEEQDQVEELLNCFQEKEFENLMRDVPKFKSVFLDQVQILKKKNSSYQSYQNLEMIYLPYVSYYDVELLAVIKQLISMNIGVKMIFCLKQQQNIQQEMQQIFQNIKKNIEIDLYNNITFLVKVDKYHESRERNVFNYNKESFQFQAIYNFLSFSFQAPQNKYEQAEGFQKYLKEKFLQLQLMDPQDILFLLTTQCYFEQLKIDFSDCKHSLCNIVLIKALLTNNRPSGDNTLKNTYCCSTCKTIHNYQVCLNLATFTIEEQNYQGSGKCQSCKNYAPYVTIQEIQNYLELKVLRDYFEYIDNSIQKNDSRALSILLLNNEVINPKSLFYQLHPDIVESKQNFQKGSDINDKFHLIQSPEFEFNVNQEDVLKKYRLYLKKQKVNFILCCINFQRSDLMKQRTGEMLKFLSGLNNLQIGLCIFSQNILTQSEQNQFLESFTLFKKKISEILFIQPNTDRQELINKLETLLQNASSLQPLNFNDTLFEAENEEEEMEMQNNFLQIQKKAEQDELEKSRQNIQDYNIKLSQIEFQEKQVSEKIRELDFQLTQLKQQQNALSYSKQDTKKALNKETSRCYDLEAAFNKAQRASQQQPKNFGQNQQNGKKNKQGR